ncbi:hypothetical protein GMD78_17585 [Ornithinibacillus sp. L9]|uniref:DUF4878 domain-containing protein n=1 Tax=Ornithinibacillus caprae TaxID=2678566 RepID=A0A6N8FPT3_9BACI|nr:alpha-galactosidase [Ornithinibacillus caprae]MUK90187.1 hypothetical protein [Ornithinibacillus caprae]
MKRNDNKVLQLIILLLVVAVVVALFITLFTFLFKSSKEQAKETVETFYAYEQNGAFSESWDMFHPLMKDKFSKEHYLQDRAHVFLNHFEVTTFDFYLEDIEKLTNWEMEEGTEIISEVYKVPVAQVYKGKYGNFTIYQNVFTTEIDGEWTILWSYQK